MTDSISFPKLPVNLADVITDSPAQLQRTINQKKSASGGVVRDRKLVETCRQMESLFINHLFKEMRASIQRSGFISGGRAEEIYTSMMDAEMAVKLSNRGGIGLADMLMQQLAHSTSEGTEDDSDLP